MTAPTGEIGNVVRPRRRGRRVIVREAQTHRLHVWEGTERNPRYTDSTRRRWAEAACDCGWHSKRVVDRPFHSISKPEMPALTLALDAYASHIGAFDGSADAAPR